MLLATRPLRDLARIVDPFIAEHLVPSLGAFPGGVPSPLWDEPMEGCPAPHATLHIGGLYDIFLPTTLDQYRRQLEFWRHGGCPRPRLILGPWTHSGYGGVYDGIAMGATSGASAVSRFGDLSSMHAAWFADVLAGRDADTAALAAVPPALVFVMGENRWRGFDELPVSTPRRLYPHTEGLASWEPCGPGVATLTSDPADPVPTLGGATMMVGWSAPGPADQRPIEARSDVLTFTTAQLADPLTLLGEVRARVEFSCDAPDTDVVVRVCRLTATGGARCCATASPARPGGTPTQATGDSGRAVGGGLSSPGRRPRSTSGSGSPRASSPPRSDSASTSQPAVSRAGAPTPRRGSTPSTAWRTAWPPPPFGSA